MPTRKSLVLWFVATFLTFLAFWKFQWLAFPDKPELFLAAMRCIGCTLVYMCVTLLGRATYRDYVIMRLGYRPHPWQTLACLIAVAGAAIGVTILVPGYQFNTQLNWLPVLMGVALFLPYADFPAFANLPKR